jgi:hypothetical protein
MIEVQDAATFRAAMRERVESATQTWQDTAAAAARTHAAAQWTKRIVRAARRIGLPAEDVAVIEAVADPEERIAAITAQARDHALETVFTARAVLDVADRHAELAVAGATGPFYRRQTSAGTPPAPAQVLTEAAALAAPTLSLAALTAAGDPRAEALWFRCGDNSVENFGELGHQQMAEYLRRHRPAGRRDGHLEAKVDDIDSVMAESRLRATILGYRGLGSLSWFQLPDAAASSVPVGHRFTDRCHVSISTSLAYAATWGRTLARIVAPAGTPAVRMDDRDPHTAEMEILLGANLTFRAGGQTWLRPGPNGVDLRLIDVQVIPGT